MGLINLQQTSTSETPDLQQKNIIELLSKECRDSFESKKLNSN